MSTQVVPNKTEMKAYLARGMTQQQIVDAWEAEMGVRVSRSAIAMAIARYDLKSSNPRPRYEEMLPWHVKDEHKLHNDARMLRLEGRRRQRKKLSDQELRWLTQWKQLLEERGAVIHYDPNTEQGFWWIRREKRHDDIIDRP